MKASQTIPRKSTVAHRLAEIAERNLANLALQAVREIKLTRREVDRDDIAEVGILIARARQILLPFVLGRVN